MNKSDCNWQWLSLKGQPSIWVSLCSPSLFWLLLPWDFISELDLIIYFFPLFYSDFYLFLFLFWFSFHFIFIFYFSFFLFFLPSVLPLFFFHELHLQPLSSAPRRLRKGSLSSSFSFFLSFTSIELCLTISFNYFQISFKFLEISIFFEFSNNFFPFPFNISLPFLGCGWLERPVPSRVLLSLPSLPWKLHHSQVHQGQWRVLPQNCKLLFKLKLHSDYAQFLKILHRFYLDFVQILHRFCSDFHFEIGMKKFDFFFHSNLWQIAHLLSFSSSSLLLFFSFFSSFFFLLSSSLFILFLLFSVSTLFLLFFLYFSSFFSLDLQCLEADANALICAVCCKVIEGKYMRDKDRILHKTVSGFDFASSWLLFHPNPFLLVPAFFTPVLFIVLQLLQVQHLPCGQRLLWLARRSSPVRRLCWCGWGDPAVPAQACFHCPLLFRLLIFVFVLQSPVSVSVSVPIPAFPTAAAAVANSHWFLGTLPQMQADCVFRRYCAERPTLPSAVCQLLCLRFLPGCQGVLCQRGPWDPSFLFFSSSRDLNVFCWQRLAARDVWWPGCHRRPSLSAQVEDLELRKSAQSAARPSTWMRKSLVPRSLCGTQSAWPALNVEFALTRLQRTLTEFSFAHFTSSQSLKPPS